MSVIHSWPWLPTVVVGLLGITTTVIRSVVLLISLRFTLPRVPRSDRAKIFGDFCRAFVGRRDKPLTSCRWMRLRNRGW